MKKESAFYISERGSGTIFPWERVNAKTLLGAKRIASKNQRYLDTVIYVGVPLEDCFGEVIEPIVSKNPRGSWRALNSIADTLA